MSHLHQNDKLNVRVDQEMLHYLRKGKWRGKRMLFRKRSSGSRSSVAVQSYLDSLNRQIKSDKPISVGDSAPTGGDKTPNNRELNDKAQGNSSSDPQSGTGRLTPRPSREERRQNSPLEEEAQSLLRQFLANSKKSKNPIPDFEQNIEASQQAHSPRDKRSDTLKQDRVDETSKQAADAKVKQDGSLTSRSKGSSSRRARRDGIHVSLKTGVDGNKFSKNKPDEILSESRNSLKRADGNSKKSETYKTEKHKRQAVENVSKTSPTPGPIKKSQQHLFKADVYESDNGPLSDSLKGGADGKLTKSVSREVERHKEQDVEKVSKTSTTVSSKQSQQQSVKTDIYQRGNGLLEEEKSARGNFDVVKNDASCLFTFKVPNSQRGLTHLVADEAKPKQHAENTQNDIHRTENFTTSVRSLVDKEPIPVSQTSSLSNTSPRPEPQPPTHESFRRPPFNLPSRGLKGIHATSSNKSFVEEDQAEPPYDMVSNKRPRRANAARVNYSLKLPKLSGSESDGAEAIHKAASYQTKAKSSFSKSPPSSDRESKIHRTRLVQSSELSQIRQELLPLPVVKLFKAGDYAPYRNKGSREKIIQSYDNARKVPPGNSVGVIIHVDFDHDEQEAMFNLISGVYSQAPVADTDMLMQDRLIQLAKLPGFDTKFIADRIDRMSELHALLSKYTSDIEHLLFSIKNGKDLTLKNDSKEALILLRRIGFISGSVVSLVTAMQAISDEDISKLAMQLLQTNPLRVRKVRSLERFLIDVRNQLISTSPSLLRVSDPLQYKEPLGNTCHVTRPSTFLRNREIGNQHHKASRTTLDRALHDTSIKKQRSWKGASNDVIVLTWSPDGTRFAAGATAQCDTHNMVYNRGNNLVLGDLTNNRLNELPDHWVLRPPPANDMADPRLYMSVSAVKWSPCGNKLFTASYDQTVKLWDVSNHSKSRCIHTFPHPAKVQVMALSQHHTSLVAVGHDSGDQSFGFWNVAENQGTVSRATYTDLKVLKHRPGKKIELLPSSLAWGTSFESKDYLIAGMSSNRTVDNGDPARDGFLTAWHADESSFRQIQLTPNSQNIFDIAWHPNEPYFAAGSSVPTAARSLGIGRSTRSVVRIYDPHQKSNILEYQCPALDINDVSFCPTDTNYVSASCTDGITYVWDYRNRDKILHKLSHGNALSELDAGMTREQADVGVRVALWGNSTDRLFTGSSDGVLKSWNILRAPEDVHLRDVVSLDSEIMSGSFSPDGTNILLGDSGGGVHILSAAPSFSNAEGPKPFDFIPAGGNTKEAEQNESGNVGIKAGQELLSTRQLVKDSRYGVGQGPNYSGPYASWARPDGTHPSRLAETPLKKEVQMEQLDHKLTPLPESRKRQASHTDSKVKRRKKRAFKEREVINLISDDEDDDALQFLSSRSRTVSFDENRASSVSNAVESNPKVDDLAERLEEDYWWPRNCDVDANIREMEV